MILIEATAAIDAAGTLETLCLSTEKFVTGATDTPAHTAFHPALKEPGRIGISAYGDGRTSGGTRLETGEIVVSNTDGRFDPWLKRSFDGRPVVIREGAAGGAYPADFPVVFRGTADGATGDMKTFVIRLRDKQYALSKALLTNRYAGSNVLPNGLEGTADDLKGQFKPRVYGKVLNITPYPANTSKLTFQVNDGAVASIDKVYDQGVERVFAADYASAALLQAAALTTGSNLYSTCKAEGLLRLHDTRLGEVTADVTEGASSGDRTIAQVLKRLALAAGISAGEVSSADVSALDALNAAEVGIYVEGETTAQDAMDQVAGSGAVYYAFDSAGILRMGMLSAPAGPAAVTLERYQIRALARRQARDNGRPVWSVSVRHSKIWTVQQSGLAGAVSAARRAVLEQDYRTAKAEDAGVKTQWLLADDVTIDTLLTSEAGAQTLADAWLELQKVPREIYDVTLERQVLTRYGLQLMSVVGLRIGRFGLDAGKLFRVIGIRPELGKRRVVLTVWG